MYLRRIGPVALTAVVAIVSAAHAESAARKKAMAKVRAGDDAMVLGDVQRAEKEYRDAIAADGTYLMAHVRLAYVASQQGKDDEAVTLLEEVAQKKGAPADTWQILATIRV